MFSWMPTWMVITRQDAELVDFMTLCKRAATTMSVQTVARRSISLPAFQGHRNCH